MSKRTPGPWRVSFIHRMIRAARETPGFLMSSPPENDWPDACLMAAAPAMYALLREFGGEGGDGFCEGCGRCTGKGAPHSEPCRIAAIIRAVEG